jgi:uncharacterized protein
MTKEATFSKAKKIIPNAKKTAREGSNPLLQNVDHRPWPLPEGNWVMKQVWHDLLFAHWPMPVSAMRPLVPTQLELDTFEGDAWVGVIPFRMSSIRRRGLPPIPGFSATPELNVRTYVIYGGKPGVYFFSLDAANLAAVWAARTFYHLPYFHAAMRSEERDATIHYTCRRYEDGAEFRGRYWPITDVLPRTHGCIEKWLTERYCLYTIHKEEVYRGEIHHLPWPLQDAEAELEINTMAAAARITLPEAVPPLLHFARKLEVLIWPLRRAK